MDSQVQTGGRTPPNWRMGWDYQGQYYSETDTSWDIQSFWEQIRNEDTHSLDRSMFRNHKEFLKMDKVMILAIGNAGGNIVEAIRRETKHAEMKKLSNASSG